MNEFDAPDNGVKQMRETIDRKDDARSRVAALDANSASDVPMNINDELVAALKGASVKDSLRAKLAIMDNEKKQNK